MNDVALVFAGDDGFARGIAVAMHSCLTNLASESEPLVFVLDNDLSEAVRARLRRVAHAAGLNSDPQFIPIPAERLVHLASESRLTTATYARLLIPDVLPSQIQRALYLDADVVARRDLSPLFGIDLNGAPFGAVRDYLIVTTDYSISGVRQPSPVRPYFNAGVLVIDVPRWRTAGLTTRALEYAAAGDEPPRFADQDALNAVADDWHELDLHWNVQHASLFSSVPIGLPEFTARLYRERRVLYRSAALLHFCRVKPWYPWCTTPGAISWVRALARTGWYDRREGARWLLGYGAGWARYRLGTLRQTWFSRLREVPATGSKDGLSRV